MTPRLPTAASDWRLMGRTTRLVLGIPGYAAVGVVAAVLAVTGFVVSQNLALVSDVVVGGGLPLSNRIAVLAGLYPFLGTSYALPSALLLVLVAVLIGADIALVAYHLREHGLSAPESGGSVVGVMLGVLGAGCAACGSVVLAGVLSLVGVTGALTLLPFEGIEFAVLALLALVLSIYWMADGMRGGEIDGCPIDV